MASPFMQLPVKILERIRGRTEIEAYVIRTCINKLARDRNNRRIHASRGRDRRMPG